MNIKVQSKTKPSGDEKRKILVKKMVESTKAGTQSYRQFLSKSGNNIQTQKLKERLKKFKAGLEESTGISEIDPVMYLKRLYYVKEMTLEDIHKKVNNLGLNYSDCGSLYYLFTDVFGWELRERSDYTDAQRKHSATLPQVEKLKACNEALVESKITEFNTAIDEIIKGKKQNKPIFSKEKYDDFTGKKSERHNKIFYLLECFDGISFEDIMQVADNTGLGARTLARVINMKTEVIRIQQNIEDSLEIKASNISYYLAERKKKKPQKQ